MLFRSVSWYREGDGAGVVWLDGRDEASDRLDAANGEPAGTSLRYAPLNASGRLIEQGVIDNLVCDCCRTDVTSTRAGAAVASAGVVPTPAVAFLTKQLGYDLGAISWQEIEACPDAALVLESATALLVAANAMPPSPAG